MKLRIIVVLCTLFSFALNACAQDIKRPDSYNYIRGIEAVESRDFQSALEYLNKEIEENPKNGYAYSWIAIVRQQNEEYGKAINALNMAIKYLPKKDKPYRSWAFMMKSQIYQSLQEHENAISCINQAIEIEPENVEAYDKRAQLYFELEKYDEADKDYKKMIALQPGEILGYMGLGRNEKMRKNFEEAIKYFDYVVKLSNEYSSGYSFRGECFFALKKYNESASDIIKALEIDHDNKAFYHMQQLADSSMTTMVTKLKVQAAKETTEGYWPYCLGIVYERNEKYKSAIENYISAFKLDNNPVISERISICNEKLGNYLEALKYINFAIQEDSTNIDYINIRALIFDDLGKTELAISEWNKYIKLDPESYFGYYRRGWVKSHTGDIEGAIEDFTTSIELEPRHTYSNISRGTLYKLIGKHELAERDFETVLERDSLREESHTIYALFHLGKIQEAKDLIQKLLEKNEDESNCYEAACLYSLAGENETSLHYLKKSLEKGNRDFNHMKRDRDLENIRNTLEFENLIKEFEDKWIKEVSIDNKGTKTEIIEKTVEIPFVKEGGVYKVECQINDLPLHFIFDTGASDVSISNVEASFMMKNEYLVSNDVMGKQNYMTANGDIIEGTVVNLRKVNFGGLKLENIKASVVKNQKAPLLLGQSVLNKLGKIEIDNVKKIIKVTYSE